MKKLSMKEIKLRPRRRKKSLKIDTNDILIWKSLQKRLQIQNVA